MAAFPSRIALAIALLVPAAALAAPPRPLSERGLDNLVAFTRLLGYVRHFDPADGAKGTSWGAFTVAAVERAEGAADRVALARVLQDQFGPLDPVLVVGTHPVTIDSLALAPADSIATWVHLGWRGEDPTRKRGSLTGRVLRVGPGDIAGRPGPAQSIRESLGAGVFCAVPRLLWADAKGTLPHAPTPVVPEQPTAPWPGDRATRLAGVALCWSVLQHFYPYFDVVGTDWDAALREALKSAATDADASAYHATLQRLTAHLEDGHVRVSGPGDPLPFVAPFSWDWAEGQLVITAASDSLGADLKRGDVVRTLDGVPVDVRYREVATRLSAATEGYRRHVALGRMPGPEHPALVLGIERADGTHKDVSVPASNRFLPFGFTRPAPIAEVRPGIWYVDVQRVDDARFDAAVDTLAHAKGVIFDVRGYPTRLKLQPLAHVADSVLTSPQWHIPIVDRPDHRDLTFRFSNWTVRPIAPRFRGKIAFLIDARAISYAETWLGIVERYRLGALVGQPTAGTNGNMTTLTLPGGYSVSFTGMKVLKHDGSRHHGVGIHPTIPAAPTVAGIRAGRDEVLEQGIRAVGG